MRTILPGLILLLSTASIAAAQEATSEPAANPRVALETSHGAITLELYASEAPATVKNFLEYVESGFYDGTIFHRVIPRFMIQGGGFTTELEKKTTRDPIQNEADNGLKNTRGTVAMARTQNPHSATAQFYINSLDNTSLDHRGKEYDTPIDHRGQSREGWGYAVFGKVVEGMEVVDAISGVATGIEKRMRDVPKTDVVIRKATVMTADSAGP